MLHELAADRHCLSAMPACLLVVCCQNAFPHAVACSTKLSMFAVLTVCLCCCCCVVCRCCADAWLLGLPPVAPQWPLRAHHSSSSPHEQHACAGGYCCSAVTTRVDRPGLSSCCCRQPAGLDCWVQHAGVAAPAAPRCQAVGPQGCSCRGVGWGACWLGLVWWCCCAVLWHAVLLACAPTLCWCHSLMLTFGLKPPSQQQFVSTDDSCAHVGASCRISCITGVRVGRQLVCGCNCAGGRQRVWGMAMQEVGLHPGLAAPDRRKSRRTPFGVVLA